MPIAALLLSLTLAAQDEAPGDIPLTKVLDALRNHGPTRYKLMYDFAAQMDASQALPSLFDLMKEEAPQLDNDVCLTVLAILKKHPSVKCPIDPLLDTIRRPVWTSQQKGSMALLEAMRDKEVWEGREEELNAALIPLLTSQRSRVYGSALRCLHKINGKREWGADPERWKMFYEAAYPGKSLDLSKALFEVLAVIRPSDEEPFSFEVNGQSAADADALKTLLSEFSAAAKRKGLKLGIVIQTSGEIQDAQGRMPPGVKKAEEAVINFFASVGTTFGYTVSPGVDVFRAPYAPKVREY